MRWRTVAVDGLVAVAALAVGAAILAGSEPVAAGVRRPDLGAYALVALTSASVLVRRRLPVVAVLGGLLAAVAYGAASYPVALAPVWLLSVYTAAAVLPARRARLLLVAAVLLGALQATLGPGPTDVGRPTLIVCAWLLGSYVGSRQKYTAELERQNRLLEQAQRDLADRAVTEERLRIARELHDVVAHTMSVVAVHAGTGRMVAEDDPAAAREALATIETATRAALLEMRGMLGVLRDSTGQGPERPLRAGEAVPDGLLPAAGLGDLDALVADVGRSGVDVQVQVEGARSDVPPGVDLSAYRIVQEALTNVIKHAGGAPTSVTVRYGEDAVVVEVEDDGPGDGSSPAMPSAGGHGLVGMRERAAMYGGRLDAGPRPGGGFRVIARLPFRGST